MCFRFACERQHIFMVLGNPRSERKVFFLQHVTRIYVVPSNTPEIICSSSRLFRVSRVRLLHSPSLAHSCTKGCSPHEIFRWAQDENDDLLVVSSLFCMQCVPFCFLNSPHLFTWTSNAGLFFGFSASTMSQCPLQPTPVINVSLMAIPGRTC